MMLAALGWLRKLATGERPGPEHREVLSEQRYALLPPNRANGRSWQPDAGPAAR